MPDVTQQARIGSSGSATVLIQHNKSGIVWVVSQFSVYSSTVRTGANCTVTRNGQPLTSTSMVPATASGYPFYKLNAPDKLEFNFTGLNSGDTVYVNASYQESQWGQPNDGNVV